MTSRPIIGIVCTVGPDPSSDEREAFFVGKPYVDRILESGGLPLLIPHGVEPRDVAGLIDGWLIIGGRDIDPAHYGQTPHKETLNEPDARFQLEKGLIDTLSPDLPILGICYGCQFLNVARGGDIIQHLPDVVGHGSHTGGTPQTYTVDEGTKLAEAMGSGPVGGKSYHHQAVGHVGAGLKVTARSDDGTIEAIEDVSSRWIVGVQWHPERTPEDPASQALFSAFVARAAQFKKDRETCGTW